MMEDRKRELQSLIHQHAYIIGKRAWQLRFVGNSAIELNELLDDIRERVNIIEASIRARREESEQDDDTADE